MDIDNLKAFIAVCDSGSFSKAADSLHLTQPAVSKRIAALEKHYGSTLLDRIGKTITLTEAGKLLLPSARQITEEINRSKHAIQSLSGAISGELRLATSHHIGLHRLPPVLRAYTAQYPEVELDLHFMDSEQACSAIERGQLELAIVTLPRQASVNLKTELIWLDPLKLVVGKTHPLAEKINITAKDLIEHSAILPSHDTFTRALVESKLKFKQSPPIALETNYLETIKMMVSIGLGWSVLPENMLTEDLVVLNLKGFEITRHLGAVYHRKRTLSSASRAMLSLVEHFKSSE